MKEIYIYVLIDPETDFIRYVGKTVNITRRYNKHLRDSYIRKYHSARWINSLLIKDIKPIIEIIEITNEENWKEREKFWIKYYREIYDLTNISEGGLGGGTGKNRIGKKNTPEHIEKCIKARTGKSIKQNDKNGLRKKAIQEFNKKRRKQILQYNLDGIFIKEWICNTVCAEELNISPGNILISCNDNSRIANGYMWRFKTDDKINNIPPYIKKESSSNVIVYQYNKENILINSYKSIKDASKMLNISNRGISNCLRGLSKSCGGFIWKYE